MTEFERSMRITNELMEEAMFGQIGHWYLSFCDSSRPKGQQFVGGCVIEAKGFTHAALESTRLGINQPGYEIQGWHIPPVSLSLLDRMLSKAELVKAGIV